MATEKEKVEYKKHTEIKTYKSSARESVKGSARHSSKFSNESSLIKDNQEKINALVRLSDHIISLDSELSQLKIEFSELEDLLSELTVRVDALSKPAKK
tara:strand:+ start:2424 stop:2720 length:297 start_codon:yes stop_codon:yes gene_type:complete